MEPKRRNELVVGTFVAVGFGLLAILVVLMGGIGQLISPAAEVRAVFSDVRGLKCGDPVSFLGSKVGRVTAVEFARKRWGEEAPDLFPGETVEMARVIITLRVDGEVLPLLRTDSPVVIEKNITGNLAVLILEGKGGPLPPGTVILRGGARADFADIAERMDGMLRRAQPAVDDLADLAKRIARSDGVDDAMKDLAVTAREVRDGLGPILEVLTEGLREAREILGENRGDIRAVASNLAEGTALATRVLAKVEPAATTLGEALGAFERAAGAAAGAIEANRPGIDAIVEETRSAVANAANLSADIRRRPWRLLYKPSPAEKESLDLYDAAWAYNLGAAGLERSIRQLAARLAADPSGIRTTEGLRTAYEEVERSLRRHRDAEEAFWARLKAR